MRSKIFKVIIVIIGIIIITLSLIPIIIKEYATNNSIELIGRQVQIEKIRYNYFTNSVKIYDFRLLEQDKQNIFVRFDTLIVNLEPLQLLKNNVTIEEFILKGLNINLEMKDSLFNFDDLIAFHTSGIDTAYSDIDEDLPLKYTISNFKIDAASFNFNNKDINNITSIKDISFKTPLISWNQEEKSVTELKFNLLNGGNLDSKLNINPVDGEYNADIIVNNIQLDQFYEYVELYSNINSFSGILNSRIYLDGNIYDILKSIASGEIEITGFSMTDTNSKVFLSAKMVGVDIKNLDYFNSSYTVDSLKINDFYTLFQMDSATNNLSQIFRLEDYITDSLEVPEDSIVAKSNNLYYAINNLSIDRGVLDYIDNLTGEPFNYHLSNITIKSDSILSNSKWIDIYSNMLLNNRGTLNAKIGIDPLDLMSANIDISIEKFLLSDINVYTHHYTGHNIIDGDMYYYSKSIVQNGELESENRLLVKNASLNRSKGGLYSLPLKLAIFLLKDKNGDLNLDIPVSGNINDPSVNIGKIAWSTFKNLIVRAAASPGRLLVGLVGGDPKDIEEIKFNYLDTIPSNKNIRQLDKLLKIEQNKKGVKIDLTYYVDTKLQKEAITKEESSKLDPEDNKIDSTVIDSIANSYSKSIIYNIEKHLHSADESTQIRVIYSDKKDPMNRGSVPTLKVSYSLSNSE